MKERAKTPARQPAQARRGFFFARGDASSFFPGASIQRKLKIGPVDDPLEREADRVADRVVAHTEAGSSEVQRQPIEEEEELLQPSCDQGLRRQPIEEKEEEPLQASSEPGVQRQPIEEEEELLQTRREPAVQRQPIEEEDELLQTRREPGLRRQPVEEEEEPLQASSEPGAQRQPIEEEEEEPLQTRREPDVRRQPVEEEEELVQPQAQLDGGRPSLSQRLAATRGGGRPLPAGIGGEMEAALGVDLGAVRVHTDEAAAEMSSELRAKAFTRGSDIYFAADRYAPETRAGRHLLAHELTHVVQQRGGSPAGAVQRDLAVRPRRPGATPRTLSPREINRAIRYNQRRITRAAEISLLRDILGIPSTPATIDPDFVIAVGRYQALYRLRQDGMVGGRTRRRLSREILAEARALRFRGLGGLATGVRLRTRILSLIRSGNTNYPTYRARIRAATLQQRDVVLADRATLRRLRNHLTWNNFARCVELLGRRAPTYGRLIRRRAVRAALRAAWTASNPAVNPPRTTQHEEGGWIYLNLITNRLAIRRQAAGQTASINLANPPPPLVTDSIVVAKFHTHPNLGPGWRAGPSLGAPGRPGDVQIDAAHGVPDIVVGSTNINPATFSLFPSGPNRRRHLAGNRGLPGAAGGLAPQAKADGTWDAQ